MSTLSVRSTHMAPKYAVTLSDNYDFHCVRLYHYTFASQCMLVFPLSARGKTIKLFISGHEPYMVSKA